MGVIREQFGIEITRLLKERKLTQRGLAERLGITSAAVCYLLKNKLRASEAQFDIIMSYLQADAPQISKLRKLWNATQKDISISKEALGDLFAIRCARNLSIEKVSQGTGISPERLRVLENLKDAEPTQKEAELLSIFLKADPAEMEELPDKDGPEHIKVAEDFADELTLSEKYLPVFSTDVLSRAAKAGSLENFLGEVPFNNTLFNIPRQHLQRAKAVLICDAEEIHYGFKGTLQIILADRDHGCNDQLFLGRGNRGGFTLWQKMRRSWKYCGAEHPTPRMLNSWCLPVLELHFIAASCQPQKSGKKK